MRQLSEEHDKKLTAVEKNFTDKLTSVNEENASLNKQILILTTQLSDLESQHKQQLSDLNEKYGTRLSEVEKRHEHQLVDVKNESEDKLVELQRQHELALAELEQLQTSKSQIEMLTSEKGELQQLYQQSAAELKTAKSRIEMLMIEKSELQQSAATLHDCESRLAMLMTDKTQLETQLENLKKLHDQSCASMKTETESQLNSLLSDKEKLQERLKVIEKCVENAQVENKELCDRNRQVVEELESKLNDASRKLEIADSQAKELSRAQESLEREHAIVVATLQQKLTAKSRVTHCQSIEVSSLMHYINLHTIIIFFISFFYFIVSHSLTFYINCSEISNYL